MGALVTIASFLLEHADLIVLIDDALKAGTDKASIMKMIRDSMVAASDAAMKQAL